MPAPFKQIHREHFAGLIEKVNFQRRLNANSVEEFQPDRAVCATHAWSDQIDGPEEHAAGVMNAASIAAAPAAQNVAPVAADAAGGRRLALCIGIDDYPTAPLAGCIADAQDWSRTFEGLAFEVRMLQNAQATRNGILSALQALISGSRSGDVLILQYAGHGTMLDDLDGDEDDGKDEALCPHDFASGAFLIDDDIRDLFAQLPNGVNLTCFFDCCHSGSNTRFAASLATAGAGAADQRRRFMPATADMQQKHREFRAAGPASRAVAKPVVMRNVSFAACQDSEVAWESNGHGDFTIRAGRVFAGGIVGLTNQQFQERVLAEFGRNARQNPRLDCADAGLALGLLQPLGAMAASDRAPADGRDATVAQLNAALQNAVRLAQSL